MSMTRAERAKLVDLIQLTRQRGIDAAVMQRREQEAEKALSQYLDSLVDFSKPQTALSFSASESCDPTNTAAYVTTDYYDEQAKVVAGERPTRERDIRVDGEPHDPTNPDATPQRDEFIRGYCERSGVTWEWLRQYRVCALCDCGDPTCEGFAMVPRSSIEDLPSTTPRGDQPTDHFADMLHRSGDFCGSYLCQDCMQADRMPHVKR